jgi:hypothetical protein
MASDVSRSITPDTLIHAVPGQVSTEMDDEAVILHVASGRYYSLAGVGNRIWKLLETPRTLADLVAQVTEEYDVEHDRCTSDVEALVRGFLDKGLVQIVSGP